MEMVSKLYNWVFSSIFDHRFLLIKKSPKLEMMEIKSITSFSVPDSCGSRGEDDQEWRRILIHRTVKVFSIDILPKKGENLINWI